MTSMSERSTVQRVLTAVDGAPQATTIEQIDEGRGVFSEVVRCALDGPPGSLVVKGPRFDANGDAATASGAYRREVLAYRTILPATPEVSAPACHAVVDVADGRPAFVLDDLTGHRRVDQIGGLERDDLRAVARELVALHRRWAEPGAVDDLDVRRATPAGLAEEALRRGIDVVDDRWAAVPASARSALRRLVDHREAVVSAFVDEGGDTLCHGDPRADNVVFAADGRAVVFDWQQLAVQFGEADLAWLLCTSATPEVRRAAEADLVADYALARGQEASVTWRRYVLGTALPGLAVLLLAQREADDDRTATMIATSLERIGTTVAELDPVTTA